MTQDEILGILKNTGALINGHFILTSGLHSPEYIEKFRVLERPEYTSLLCKDIADKFRSDKITVVAGPMTGGIILAYEVGKQLGVRAIFTERIDGIMQFRRGFSISPSDNVLIVEDVITTGSSVQEVINEVRKSGASIAGLAYLVDRSNGRAQFDMKAIPLITINAVTYNPTECPLCKAGIPAVKPGSSKKL